MPIYQPYLNTLRRYFDFEGRTGRREFWLTVLVSWVISAVLFAFDVVVFSYNPFSDEVNIAPLATVYGLLVFLPFLGLYARRLHDIGRSGWWLLIGFVPFVGFILVLVWFIRPSDPYENAYGPPPMSPSDMDMDMDPGMGMQQS